MQTPHHYVFAHIAIKTVCLSDPYGFFTLMSSPKRTELIHLFWKEICREYGEPKDPGFSPEDITVVTESVKGYPAVIIRMPEPGYIGEAHMVCIVLKVTAKEMACKPPDPEVGYFTLEKGCDFTEEDGSLEEHERTVLCAWKGGIHFNYGTGPEATVEAFTDAVKERL